MKNKQRLFAFMLQLAVGTFLLNAIPARATTFDWSGTYRFEYLSLEKPALRDPESGSKAFGLNSLSLSPKIVVNDGMYVVANMLVFPNEQYPNSQMGMYLGGGQSANPESSSATSQMSGGTVQVNQLYMSLQQEYGQFVAGRMPLHFGLGIYQNAGLGLYDHWTNSHDLVGYKVMIGNLGVMPMVGRANKESSGLGADTGEVIWHIDYNNREAKSRLGIFHHVKTGNRLSNDAWKVYGTSNADLVAGWNSTYTGAYLTRSWDEFDFGLEAGFQKGTTGVAFTDPGGRRVEIGQNAFGIAIEMNYQPKTGDYRYSFKTGMASGDNPRTLESDEGFYFNRNYNLGFLLFNQRLGSRDNLRTDRFRRLCSGNPQTCATPGSGLFGSDEFLSNAFYFAPTVTKRIAEKWDWRNVLVHAQLIDTNPPTGTTENLNTSLGIEWNTGVIYKANERFEWLTEFGILFPGSAWDSDVQRSRADVSYGLQTKAVVRF